MASQFVLPEGIKLTMTEHGLVIEHTGDLLLQGQVNGGIHQVTSLEGDVVLEADYVLQRIDAPNGTVHVKGELEAERIEAKTVVTEGPALTVRVIQAAELAEIQDAMVHAEVIVAPTIRLSSDTRGRITVVECHNDLDATKVKGCLSLSDIEELFEGSRGFIEGWDIRPLSGRKTSKATAKKKPAKAKKSAKAKKPEPEPAPPPVAEEETLEGAAISDLPEEEAAAEVVEAEAPEEQEEAPAEVVATEEPETAPADGAEPANGAEPAAAAAPPPIEMPAPSASKQEQIEHLFDLFDEDLEEGAKPGDPTKDFPTPTEIVADPATEAKIREAIDEIVGCYDDGDTPPAISRLAELVANQDYTTVRDEVDDIWNKLLQFHKEKKLRPKPALTTSFNTIHAIVREL